MTNLIKDITVVVATKGRPKETAVLLDSLACQTLPPQRVVIVGVDDADIDIATSHGKPLEVHAWKAASAGLTIQRNEAVRWLRERSHLGEDAVVIFFDDDFRPAADWIACCVALFDDLNLAGMTGRILADGILGPPITEADAARFLSGAVPPQPHWATGTRRTITSVYGCNMAFAGRVLAACLFDESLPLYGWQEDRDMTGQAKRFGDVIFSPVCSGVHLGASGARTNGARLGYSQIANIVYLWRKGTVDGAVAARFLSTSLAANLVRSVYKKRGVDHVGRLKGNVMALVDLAKGRCEPRKILDM